MTKAKKGLAGESTGPSGANRLEEPALDPLLACEMAVSGHSTNAVRALANRQIEAALTSLEKAIILCEASPTLPKDADSHFQLLAKLVRVCRLFCEKYRPDKVDDALKLVQRVDRIEQAGIH